MESNKWDKDVSFKRLSIPSTSAGDRARVVKFVDYVTPWSMSTHHDDTFENPDATDDFSFQPLPEEDMALRVGSLHAASAPPAGWSQPDQLSVADKVCYEYGIIGMGYHDTFRSLHTEGGSDVLNVDVKMEYYVTFMGNKHAAYDDGLGSA